jgi:biotin operon repressor
LRQAGHKIEARDNRYYLTAEATGQPQPAVKRPYHRNGTPKHAIALELLAQAGKEGVDKEELTSKLGINSRNLVFHIHSLRRKKCRIEYKNGRYFLRGKPPELSQGKMAPSGGAGSFMQPAPTSMPGIQVTEKVVRKLKLLSPEDRGDYLDMLKKANFYSMCAEALVSATEFMETIKKEVESES